MAQDAPHPVDTHVGARLRQRRHMLRMSQSELAAHLGLTFQQLQKYEKGANRISASKLYAAACKLEISMAWFFEGLSDTAEELPNQAVNDRSASVQAFLATREGLELARLAPSLSARERRQLLALVSTLADQSTSDGEDD